MEKVSRRMSIFTLLVGLVWFGCGTDKSLSPAGEAMGLSKPVQEQTSEFAFAPRPKDRATVRVLISRDGVPASGVTVAFARSIAGRVPNYQWTGTTDASGIATIAIANTSSRYYLTGASGQYLARATVSGSVIGTWHSIPVGGGRGTILSLSVGQPAAVKRGLLLTDEMTSPSLEGNLLGDSAVRKMTIYLPPSYNDGGTYPVVYLLHGYGGNERSFVNGRFRSWRDFPKQGFVGMVDDLIASGQMQEMIIVMPNAANKYGGSFYTNSPLTGNYEDYIVTDLVGYIDGHYRTIASANSRAVAGHSMGGYGAMKLAMKHPEVFSAVASHSGVYNFDKLDVLIPWFLSENADGVVAPSGRKILTSIIHAMSAAFSPNLDNPPFYVDLQWTYPEGNLVEDVWAKWLQHDPLTMLDTYGANLASFKGVYMDVGPSDVFQLNLHMEGFLAGLDAAGVDYRFVDHGGGHSDKMFERLQVSLPYLSNALTGEGAALIADNMVLAK